MNYQPNPGSVASRVIAYLSSKPPGFTATNAVLSREVGAPAGSFAGNLNMAVNAGLVHKQAGNGLEMVWALGPRVAASTQANAQEHATAQEDDATVIRQPAISAPDPVAEEIKHILDAQEVATQAPAGFACALFNDGRLYLELGDETMTLQVEHTRALLAYLERVAPAAAAAQARPA